MKIEHDTVPAEVHTYIPEHQVLLSFNADEDAIAFYRWWAEAGGRDLFVSWAKKIDFDIAIYSAGGLPDAHASVLEGK